MYVIGSRVEKNELSKGYLSKQLFEINCKQWDSQTLAACNIIKNREQVVWTLGIGT